MLVSIYFLSKIMLSLAGKFVRWIRRRESKRQRPRLSLAKVPNEPPVTLPQPVRNGIFTEIVDVGRVAGVDGSVLGVRLAEGPSGEVAVVNVALDGPLYRKVAEGKL